MSRENNRIGIVYAGIETPKGERIAYDYEIDAHEFHDFLKPIHINKHPFRPDNEKEIEQQKQKREYFIDLLCDRLRFSFKEYLESKDTIDGDLIKDKIPKEIKWEKEEIF